MLIGQPFLFRLNSLQHLSLEYRRLPRASSCLGEIWLCHEYDASEKEQFFDDLNCAFSECSNGFYERAVELAE